MFPGGPMNTDGGEVYPLPFVVITICSIPPLKIFAYPSALIGDGGLENMIDGLVL